MTVRAILGLSALNVLVLVVGSTFVWAIRGWDSWVEYARLAGLSYLLGVAMLGIVWTNLLVLGVPFGTVTILVSAAVLVGAALASARGLGRQRPARGTWAHLTGISLVSAVAVALTGVFLEALFRAARLQGLYAFDAWAFWIPKAKAIYFFGGLDVQFFRELPGPTYPPLLPILDAAAFHAMGRADVVTLHLQYWFLTCGFVAASAGLLWRRVPGWILWPSLVLVLVMPRASERLVTPQADFLLAFLVCTAALLLAFWLLDRNTWQLIGASALLGAGVLTKREGVLLAAILLVALLVATLDRRRVAWRRIGLVALAVAVVGIPWRLWYVTHGIGGEAPRVLSWDLGRGTEALRLSVEVFADTSLWSVVTLVIVASVVSAAIWGRRRLALFFGLALGLMVLGGGWITLSHSDLPITADEALNPIVRYTMSAVLLGCVATPLLLSDVWAGRDREERAPK